MSRRTGLKALPVHWETALPGGIAQVNPRFDGHELNGDLEVSFVPMRSVEAETGAIDLSLSKRLSEDLSGEG